MMPTPRVPAPGWRCPLAREMVWVERERFHGWTCSVCAWVFNGSGPLVDKSIEEMKRRYEAERDKEFRRERSLSSRGTANGLKSCYFAFRLAACRITKKKKSKSKASKKLHAARRSSSWSLTFPKAPTDFLFQSLSNERSAAFAASHAADIGRVDVELLRDSLVNASENGNCTQ